MLIKGQFGTIFRVKPMKKELIQSAYESRVFINENCVR